MKKVGKIVNTHGIKGELRILSGGSFSNNDFKPEYKTLIIQDKKYKVTSYRFHKKFHQVFFEGFNDINDVLFLKGQSVFVDQKDDSIDIDNLIGANVYQNDKKIGVIKSISNTKLYKLINLDSGQVIPLNEKFVVSMSQEKVEVKNI